MRRLVLRSSAILLGGACAVKGYRLAADIDDFDDIGNDFRKLLEFRNFFAPPATVKKPKVVILGTGWASISFLQKLDQDKVDLKIVSPRPFFFYTPLLAGSATGTVSHNSIIEPIRWYCTKSGQRSSTFLQAECNTVDIKKKCITCSTESGDEILLDYDYLIVGVGAESATFGISGVHENAMFMKEVHDAISFQQKILDNLEKASFLLAMNKPSQEVDKLLHFVIIGGGPTGVESTAELTDLVQQDITRYFPNLAPRVKLTLIEATDRILAVFDKDTAQYAQSVLVKRGATVICNAMVKSVTSDAIVFLKDGATVTRPYGALIWAAGITARPVVRHITAQLDPQLQNSNRGIVVDSHFRVRGVTDNSVWALGDCCVSGCGPTAQAAMQQGKYLGKLFRQLLSTDSLRLDNPRPASTTNATTIPSDDSRRVDVDITYSPAVLANAEAKRIASENVLISAYPGFSYSNKGALAYVGGSKGVAQLKSLLWDRYPTPNGEVTVEGVGAFAIWRSLYFSRLMSGRNQVQVAFDWLKTSVFGRDISSPIFTYQSDRTKK